MKKILIVLVKTYKIFISPALMPACRFHPTCSAYAAEALKKHGVVKGLYYAARRLLRCHPWNKGSLHDPVP